ncbi:adenosylcobyric acid synthase (glutamine-hydrolysing) [Synechococcus sp. PCC 7502]|uniref:cobyric acid synthase n=1 Tax=Synechococcus sp. PCC 7502 TaxID=1173263 RepID=UPI00029F9EDB|nr:cobyric acid synthase [Synechococcus sp. PCC 7502]AFY75178.1 adenosylcobyric acid synthase (glutamine-hydrolysing) [Synechococcus sp. PCC 7502]
MKAISVLGTSSNAGKSWLVTALGAWLYRQGVNVAPFKSQNMSNNSYVTLEGGEIGRAQAVQAIACGMRPIVEMNPILLKPSAVGTSQLVILGTAKQHIAAIDYYQHIETLWQTVCDCLEFWRDRCDVLLLEGAGSPVELNLMHRDLVNLRPIQYLNGRWLLVGDIEKGGVFAQIIGTHQLMPKHSQAQGLGLIVNKFRGDLRLFADADKYFKDYIPDTPYLGVLPYCSNLQPESEDSLCAEAETKGKGAKIAWVRFPHLSNSQDSQPWQLDFGIETCWVQTIDDLRDAKIIILPGSKNTIADLEWLKSNGLDRAIIKAASQGVPIVGICGGYQMLGISLGDRHGVAGAAGMVEGLGLLPVTTEFLPIKQVRQVQASFQADTWMAYEIHMGHTQLIPQLVHDRNDLDIQPLVKIQHQNQSEYKEYKGEGWRSLSLPRVWGTYLHGLFESSQVRQALIQMADISDYQVSDLNWQTHQQTLYNQMADLLEIHLDLNPIRRYLSSP